MKLKKGDMIFLKQKYGFKNLRAKVLEIYKDTIKVMVYGYSKMDIRLIFKDDIKNIIR
jgi:sRNA-binding protein